MLDLSSRKILLIVPKFFTYGERIRSAIIARGGAADLIFDRPFKSALMHLISKIAPFLAAKIAQRYHLRELRHLLTENKYETVLVINGQTLSRRTLLFLRDRLRNSKFVLYMWDSVENRKGVLGNIDLYDFRYTFDPKVSKQYGFTYRPLFYFTESASHSCDKRNYDLCFIGTAHSDRYQICRKIEEQMTGRRFYKFLYLQSKWVYFAAKLIRPGMLSSKMDEFAFAPMPYQEIEDIYKSSFAVLDIEHPNQTGLTTRAIETIAMGRKLISTNIELKNERFYRENNICIIDRGDPKIDEGFFEREFEELDQRLMFSYSIDGWLSEVLGAIG